MERENKASLEEKLNSSPVWNINEFVPSLSEAHSSVQIPSGAGFWRKFLAFSGPGLLVAVGYMDPGNWATDLAGGAKFGYTLLSVILISNLIAMLLQHLSLKLGIVSGRDLAQACRHEYGKVTNFILWILCEVAIAACDLAEVIGSAIAINLLFGIPLVAGVLITSLDVLVLLYLQGHNYRTIEYIVGALILLIGGCFAYQILASSPAYSSIVHGLLPQAQIVTDPSMLYIAIGILGATVMPHNLYLHSSIVQTRAFKRDDFGKKMAVRYATLDSCLALFMAFFINAAILIVSAAVFHSGPYQDLADISDAYKLLSPVVGDPYASTFFAIALLASGQNSTLTGTMAGQIVMEGFLDLRLRPWVRRLLTRLVAIVPAVVIAALYGERGIGSLLVLSQVILSLQLGFAVVPLVMFTSDKSKMGSFANRTWLKSVAWGMAGLIIVLNLFLLLQVLK